MLHFKIRNRRRTNKVNRMQMIKRRHCHSHSKMTLEAIIPGNYKLHTHLKITGPITYVPILSLGTIHYMQC